jgi:hypothetical protein
MGWLIGLAGKYSETELQKIYNVAAFMYKKNS